MPPLPPQPVKIDPGLNRLFSLFLNAPATSPI